MLDRPGDPIAEVIALLRVTHQLSTRLNAGGDWALDFAPEQHVKFSCVLSGRAWLEFAGSPAVELHAGDAFLARGGTRARMGSDLALPASPAGPVFLAAREGDGIARAGSSEETRFQGGHYEFDAASQAWLVDALPGIVVMRHGASGAAGVVSAAVDLLVAELASPGLGFTVVADRLAGILLVQALRVIVASGDGEGPAGTGASWLRGLADPQIGTALRLMHGDVARRWTVAELAGAVALSRSGFAARFRELVGLPPLEYLLRWRMLRAARALEDDPRRPVSSVSAEWGYTSDSAFSNAFRRVMGSAPSHFRAGEANAGEGRGVA